MYKDDIQVEILGEMSTRKNMNNTHSHPELVR